MGLPQGRFEKTISTPLQLGQKWGFRENPEMGLKGAKVGFDPFLPTFAPKNPLFDPLFDPLLDPFQPID